MTKDEILAKLDETRGDFLKAIEGLTDEQLQEPGVNGDWTVKDLMHHISLWEAELVTLLWQAKSGKQPTTVHFTQSHFDDTNQEWYEQGKDRSLEDVRQDFDGVLKQIKRRVGEFSEDELNQAGRYPWQREYTLWEWIGSDSFTHEPEHTEMVKAWRQRRGY